MCWSFMVPFIGIIVCDAERLMGWKLLQMRRAFLGAAAVESEGLDQQVLSAAVNAIRHADMLIIGGTSLTVYPAAGLVDYYEGNKLVLINKSVTAKEAHADLVITEPIGQVFQRCVLGENCSEDAQTSDRR